MENQNYQNQDFNSTTGIQNDAKTIAIISYMTFIGLIIAFVMNNDKKFPLANYHIKQSLGIMLTGLVISVVNVIPFVGWIVGILGAIFVIVLWIFGLISAINGEQKPVPVLGTYYQDWFKSI